MLFVYSLSPFLIFISTLYISTNVHFSFTFSFLISTVSLLWGTLSLLQASHLQRGRLEKASCLFSSLGETLCQHCGRWPMTSSDRESSLSKTSGSCHTNLCVWTPHMCLESLGQGWVWLLYLGRNPDGFYSRKFLRSGKRSLFFSPLVLSFWCNSFPFSWISVLCHSQKVPVWISFEVPAVINCGMFWVVPDSGIYAALRKWHDH